MVVACLQRLIPWLGTMLSGCCTEVAYKSGGLHIISTEWAILQSQFQMAGAQHCDCTSWWSCNTTKMANELFNVALYVLAYFQ